MKTSPLLVKFDQVDHGIGVTRATLKAVAQHLGVSETRAVHIAINRLHRELFPQAEGEMLSSSQLAGINARADREAGPGVALTSLNEQMGLR